MGLERELAKQVGSTPTVVTLAATTATRLTTTETTCARGIVITADPANGSDIFIGTSNEVTNVVKWYAFVRPAFGPILIPIQDASNVWVYTTGSSQKFGWAVT